MIMTMIMLKVMTMTMINMIIMIIMQAFLGRLYLQELHLLLHVSNSRDDCANIMQS